MKTILVVIGTRPEAIKLAPVIIALKNNSNFKVIVFCTGQHKELVEEVLVFFDIEPSFKPDRQQISANLSETVSNIMKNLSSALDCLRPDLIFCHGDTASAFAASQVGFLNDIPVAHVEAGLRTYQLSTPFPEEYFRQVIDRVADLKFCPTQSNLKNILSEMECYAEKDHVQKECHVVGNTVIDACRFAENKIETSTGLKNLLARKFREKFGKEIYDTQFILVTCHRRENITRMEHIFKSLSCIAKSHPNYMFIHIRHPNPNVMAKILQGMGDESPIISIEPVPYEEMIFLLSNSFAVVTDSGGLQEECVALDTPCLVLRDATEREEATHTGLVSLIGNDPEKFTPIIQQALQYGISKENSLSENPFGDGQSSIMIAQRTENYFNLRSL